MSEVKKTNKDTNEIDDVDVSIDEVLDFIRKSEKTLKGKVLLRATKAIKGYAAEINLLKLKSKILLEEISLGDKEINKIISFVNELPEIKNIPESTITKIREEQRNVVLRDKAEIQKTLDKKTEDIVNAFPSVNGIYNLGIPPNSTGIFYDGNNMVGYSKTYTAHSIPLTTCGNASVTNSLNTLDNMMPNNLREFNKTINQVASCMLDIPFGNDILSIKL